MNIEIFSGLAYIVSATLFILAIKGLSHPASSKKGNIFGMIAMALAIGVTLMQPVVTEYLWIFAGIAIGGTIGAVIAKKIDMRSLPELVAGFHSLVGLAAVFVALAAFYNPAPYAIGEVGAIHAGSLIEMSLGAAIGAITFTGSLVAFGKLQGFVSGNPVTFKGQHWLNLALGVAVVLKYFLKTS